MGSSHDSSFQRINPREKGDWKSGDQVARVPRKGGQAHEEAMASVGDPKSWSTPIRDLGIPPSPHSKNTAPKALLRDLVGEKGTWDLFCHGDPSLRERK